MDAKRNATGPAGDGGAKQKKHHRNYNKFPPKPDYQRINAAALQNLPSILARWLPDGHQRGHEWVVRNPTRNDSREGSFSVNLNNGKWADFATGDKGGDPISLAAYLFGLWQSDAARELATMLGVDHG